MAPQNNPIRLAVLLLFLFFSGCSGQRPLTVAEVVQNAKRLDGKTIRVRALAYLWSDPTQPEMWMSGGCVPRTDPSYRQGSVKGWLTLYDSIDRVDIAQYGVPHEETGITISGASFHCGGDTCKITCSPFKMTSQQMYEFVGKLQVKKDSEFVLENIDSDQSRQFVDGKWMPLSVGNFDVMFP